MLLVSKVSYLAHSANQQVLDVLSQQLHRAAGLFSMGFADYKVEQRRVKICPKVSGAEPRGQIELDENAGKVK